MKYQFAGKTPWGEWVIGNLIEGKNTTFIVPSSLIFSQSRWLKVDPKTVKLLNEDDFDEVESKISEGE